MSRAMSLARACTACFHLGQWGEVVRPGAVGGAHGVPPSPREPGLTGTGSGARPAAPRSPTRSSTAATAAPRRSDQRPGEGRAVEVDGVEVAAGRHHQRRHGGRAGGELAEQQGDGPAQLGPAVRRTRRPVDRGQEPPGVDAVGGEGGEVPHQPVHAADVAGAGDHHDVGRRGEHPGTGIAVLHVERAGLGLALEVRVGVGDDGGVGPAKRGDRRVEGPAVAARSSRGGGAARAGGRTHGRGTPTGELRTWVASGRPVRCSSTSSWSPGTTSPLSWSRARLASRAASTRATRPPLAGSAPAAWATPMATVEVPLPPAPTTVISRPEPARRTVVALGLGQVEHVAGGPLDGAGVLAQHGEDRVAVDRFGEHGHGARGRSSGDVRCRW